ncbi:unnamed protein product [Cladocopium goreaui]|uniref:RNA-binding protein 25 n=1 Tax=Cladocopium goreaui TaxID=2562237 RepID=A0A9P1BUU2_9DINO|nr:unnamed protein product [Cladocopium goreaui]
MAWCVACCTDESQQPVEVIASEVVKSPSFKAVNHAASSRSSSKAADSEGRSFTVVVPTKDFSTLGLQMDATEPRFPMVLGIEDGAIQEFNKVYQGPGIQPFDVLMAVDGTQSWDAIRKKMAGKLPDRLFLSLHRPRRIEVLVEKTGQGTMETMGMRLAYTDKSVGVFVQEIHPKGLIAKWNAARDAGERIEVLDRIVEFDGKTCTGTQLAMLLEEQKTWRLTVLKHDECDNQVLQGLSRQSF